MLILCLIMLWPISRALALTPDEQQSVMLIKQAYGKRAGMRVTAWRQLLADIQQQRELAQLQQVNSLFNQLLFLDDLDIWGQSDYWATPLEFLGVGAGDCEDFSIAKYFSLRELGIADEKLRLIYVKALSLDQFHMVLAYYPSPAAVPLVLDNLTPDILRATERHDLQPIYSFNGSKLWLMKLQGEGQSIGKASQLKKWNLLRSRFRGKQLAQPIIDIDND
ncbi:transglutaminase-like cysteine peptidase [Photobacterium nomapromontoriensis]|uniref:transglutaminase-like cysteine peptidase n=1 Tax=Photobacterium nomapromontoriensis TaxID=2910237 RepID=UPI003D0AB0A6